MDEPTKDKIEILFKEYGALRTEITTRISSAFGLWSVASAVIILWATQHVESWWNRGILIMASLALLTLWILNERATRRCGLRVAEIEREINALAGEELLKWENKGSASARGRLSKLLTPSGWSVR